MNFHLMLGNLYTIKHVSCRGIFQKRGEKEEMMEQVEDLFVGICLLCALEWQRPKY